jgi:hypothetical protein
MASEPASQAASETQQDPQHCSNLHPYAQCPLQVGQAYRSAPKKFHHSSPAQPAHRSRRVGHWPRAPFAARRCWLKRWAKAEAASKSFAETAGLRPGPLAWRCCATCWRMRPTIAGRCACLLISSDSRYRMRQEMGCGTGRSCGRRGFVYRHTPRLCGKPGLVPSASAHQLQHRQKNIDSVQIDRQ